MQLPKWVNADLIHPGLYQGAAPPVGPTLKAAGFDTVVLCAEEWQPPRFVDPLCRMQMGYTDNSHPYPGLAIVYAPNDDNFSRPPTGQELFVAGRAAGFAANRIRAGGNVYVSCWAGKNRSSLVTGLTIHALTGLSGIDCLLKIKKARPEALTNPQFRAALARIQAVQLAAAV